MNAGSLSGRTGAIKELPKGKNKYTLAPIDHLKSAQKVGNYGMMLMPPPFPQMAAGGMSGGMQPQYSQTSLNMMNPQMAPSF